MGLAAAVKKQGGIWSAVASAARHRSVLRKTTSAARRRPPRLQVGFHHL